MVQNIEPTAEEMNHKGLPIHHASFIIHRSILIVVGLLFSPLSAAMTSATARLSVETVVYHAIAASFLENPRLIQRYADELSSYDLVLQAERGMPSGCADNLAWLWTESLATPAARLAGYRAVLPGRWHGPSACDSLVETSLHTAMSETLTARIRDTRSQDRWDRWADILNATGHNLGRMANGQLAAGAKLLIDLTFSRRQFTKVTERERKQWWLIDTYLRREPDGPEAERLRQRMDRLESKFRKDAVRKCMQVAHYYADRGWWHEAYFYVRAAEQAGYGRERKFRRKVRRAVANEKRWTERSLAVADTERFLATADQVRAYGALLETLSSGDSEALRNAITTASPALADTPMADETEEVRSVLFDWAGDRRRAMDVQRDLALRYPETQTGRAALARLDDPQYNPRARFDRELAEFRRRQRRYVFFGERKPRQQLEMISRLATPPMPQLGAASAFFVTDMLVRSVLVSFGNPVSPDDVLATGEQLLANPHGLLTPEEQADVRVALGVLYQKLRRYDQAAAAYREARILSPALDSRLAERAADERLRRILQLGDANHQVLLLEQIVSTYPKTKAAARARHHLERFRTESKVDFEIPYDWLAQDPIHWIRLGARIPNELIDGTRSNGEMNERGLVFWLDFPSSATYVCVDRRTSGYVNLTPRRRAILRAAAEMWADERIALEAGQVALAGRKLPFAIRGSLGAEGLIAFPTLQHIPLSEEDKRLFR